MASPALAAAPDPYGTDDYGGFRNVLPPGTNGLTNATDLFNFESQGTYAPHARDQYDMYANLVYAVPGLTAAQIPSYYKDATFGVQAGQQASVYSPPLRPGVVIVRDTAFGVPHVYGDTRGDVLYGAGYVCAEDRLFFTDVLRHAGRAQLSGFAGASNRDMDIEQWEVAPYTEQDLQVQGDQLDDLYGSVGVQLQQDALDYIAGINGYVTEARVNPNKMPVEYAAIGQSLQDFQNTDIIAIASLVGGIFGKGGGNEVGSSNVLNKAIQRFGDKPGKQVWRDFRRAEDPEAPVTAQSGLFRYQVPKNVRRSAVAIPDDGSVVEGVEVSGSGGTSPSGATSSSSSDSDLSKGVLSLSRGNSNALLVSAASSQSGRPIAVMGPQVSYFMPQILNEQDLHCLGACSGGPDIDAAGASFPGISGYVLLGHGQDYAWSATSAGQDIIDTFAEVLCNTDGSQPTINSDHYMYKGQCRAMETLTRTNTITPNAGDPCGTPGTPQCGQFTITAYRTVHGIVVKRGTVNGQAVAFAQERSTYMHEVDSARAFMDINDPAKVNSAQTFQQAASKIGFTFNWFYADDQDIAYFNSGDNPVRADGIDPNFPTWGTGEYDWRGFNSNNRTATYTPFSEHPQVVNQPFITSWNNKQAHGYRAADDNFAYGPIHRSLSLDRRVQAGLSGGAKMNLAGLISAMGDAGTVDLRGSEVLPYMLDVVGTPSDPDLANAVIKLRDWVASGAHRRDLNQNGVYDDAEAVQIMDAWWPRAIQAQFQSSLGTPLFDAVKSMIHFDDDPNSGSGYHVGSAYIDGWYGYVQKDLRRLLGRSVVQAFSRVYCGAGSLTRCRDDLRQSLRDALDVPATQLYDEDPGAAGVNKVDTCPSGKSDQWCWDSVRFRPIGAITLPTMPWINRPTFQQVVEVQGHRPR